MVQMETYVERLNYLILKDGNVNSPRAMAMSFYKSRAWLETRKKILYRDSAFDLGIFGVYIDDKVTVHHINPITDNDIVNNHPKLLDPENLITVSLKTHNTIHYGQKEEEYVERRPGDTLLW